jgi:hypothetical protein
LIFIGVWVSGRVAAAVDKAVHTLKLDRSAFLRSALAEKLGARQRRSGKRNACDD